MNAADRFIERVEHLPPAPAVVTQLLGLFSDPNRELDRIIELISYDPSLTAEVLKRCNSAFFRGAEPASDIFEAVTRLGFFEVYSVVATLVGGRSMSIARASAVLDTNALWRHSVTTAVAGGVLARHAMEPEAPAFTAGLLHDIGKLVLAAAEGNAYAGILKQVASGPALAHAEYAGLGVNHADVGARLLTRWGLPPNLTLAVMHHHSAPGKAGAHERLLANVHFANLLAHHVADAAEFALDSTPAMAEAAGLLRVTAEDVAGLVDQTRAGSTRILESI